MDPSDIAHDAISGTAGRGDATYIAVIAIIFCGLATIAMAWIMVRWLPALLDRFTKDTAIARQDFREEMALERGFHAERCKTLLASFESHADRVIDHLEKKG